MKSDKDLYKNFTLSAFASSKTIKLNLWRILPETFGVSGAFEAMQAKKETSSISLHFLFLELNHACYVR